MKSPSTTTGRPPSHRRRHTRWAVRLSDAASRAIITVGGIGTIVAILLVGVFLVWVVVPLFAPAGVTPSASLPAHWPTTNPEYLAVDDQQAVGFGLEPGGLMIVLKMDDAAALDRRELFPGKNVTACAPPNDSEEAAFGFADGTVCLGAIGTRTSPAPTPLPEDLRGLAAGRSAGFRGGLLTRTNQGEFQWTRVSAKFGEPLASAGNSASAVLLLDYVRRPSGTVYGVFTAENKLRLNFVSERTNLTTDEVVRDVTACELPLDPSRGRPLRVLINNVGDSVYVVWPDGHLARYNAGNTSKPALVEELDLVEPGCRITAAAFLIGRTTLLCGDSAGRVRGWFPTHAAGGVSTDGVRMVSGHEYKTGSTSPVTALAASARSRVFAVGLEDGSITLFQATTGNRVGDVVTEGRGRVEALAISPKDDGLAAMTSRGLSTWRMDLRYPEATLAALFGKVWYEGAASPEYAWQSTGGADAFEPKLSLIPLIVGTLKATFYSMLFGVPLALLAAIYTSEFLTPRAKARIKPTVEMMASLPSVVLGFIAGLVLAPLMETHVAAALAGIFTVPLVFLVGGHLWQMLPAPASLRLTRYRFLFILAALPLGLLAAPPAGSLIERLLFAGDIKHWLADPKAGSGLGGWIVMLMPVAGVAAAAMIARWINPWLRYNSGSWNRPTAALVESAKLAGGILLTVALAAAGGQILQSLGWDPRGTFYGKYDQRNALVVGFIMGFAIIPIIYTIADDALSAVPEHLRSASLGAGATPWQTAVRITIPTAMSGLFSALMVGLGRAVGETMIVLMAAGSTPIMDWNIFNGFRTLSANIAIEMPEAVRDSLHYRTLFLCAVVLFAMTFVLNTIAEVVRQRFRRRAYQL